MTKKLIPRDNYWLDLWNTIGAIWLQWNTRCLGGITICNPGIQTTWRTINVKGLSLLKCALMWVVPHISCLYTLDFTWSLYAHSNRICICNMCLHVQPYNNEKKVCFTVTAQGLFTTQHKITAKHQVWINVRVYWCARYNYEYIVYFMHAFKFTTQFYLPHNQYRTTTNTPSNLLLW